MLPLAHAGHWTLWLLYAVPVIVVLGSIIASVRRERRERDGGEPRREVIGAEGRGGAGLLA